MEYIVIGVGVFMMVLGWLLKKYPNLIAGYNHLSQEQRKKVNIEGLSNWMRLSFIVLGLLIIAGYFLLNGLGLEKLANYSIIMTSALGIFIIAIGAQRFNS